MVTARIATVTAAEQPSAAGQPAAATARRAGQRGLSDSAPAVDASYGGRNAVTATETAAGRDAPRANGHVAAPPAAATGTAAAAQMRGAAEVASPPSRAGVQCSTEGDEDLVAEPQEREVGLL